MELPRRVSVGPTIILNAMEATLPHCKRQNNCHTGEAKFFWISDSDERERETPSLPSLIATLEMEFDI